MITVTTTTTVIICKDTGIMTITMEGDTNTMRDLGVLLEHQCYNRELSTPGSRHIGPLKLLTYTPFEPT